MYTIPETHNLSFDQPLVLTDIWARLVCDVYLVDVNVWVDDGVLYFRLVHTGLPDSPSPSALKYFERTFEIGPVEPGFDHTTIRAIGHTNDSAICLIVGAKCYMLQHSFVKNCSRLLWTPLTDITNRIICDDYIHLELSEDDMVDGLQMFHDYNYYLINKTSTVPRLVFPKRLV